MISIKEDITAKRFYLAFVVTHKRLHQMFTRYHEKREKMLCY